MSDSVFISYRRDKHALARSVAERLTRDGVDVFLDSDSLGEGDFPEQLLESIKRQDALIAVITEGSLERCRNNPNDFCRLEMTYALELGKKIVIVAEDRTVDLRPSAFPAELAPLASLNALFYSHDRFEDFVDQLFEYLNRTPDTVLLQRWADLGKVERSEEYRFWLVRHLQQTLGPQLGDEAFPEVGGVVYPVLIHEAATPEQPFTHEPAKDSLLSPLRDPGEVVYASGRPQAPDWITSDTQRRYFELLVASRSVRRWNMRGFALQSLELDERGRVIGSTSTLATYGENCLTSHVLGYELMTHFLGEEKCVRPELRYYEQAAGKSLCFSIEQGFYPLISVQALVVIKGRRDDWTALVMQRSQDVAAAAGFWQFPPAGGFEILGSEDEDAFVVRRQFDLRQALIREFLEEVYGDDDLTSAADVNPELVGSPGYRLVMDAIEDGQLTIHLLGVVTDLVSLRPEFSFLIVIDDPDLRKREYQTETGNWARWLRRSSEAKRIFEFSIPEVQEHLTSSGPWNPSSAGLFKLFWDALNEPDGWLASRYPSLKSCVQ